ncbi:MAG TPA: MFS transporter [Solirubrobacteraceae bacterium]|nr:MFS transporter [Solirubrobacteraceae bacterium]
MTPWWRKRSVVITAGCLIALITFGARTSFGLFTEPLSDLRGWDRGTFAFAIAIQNLLWGLGQPAAGAIADRFGPARVLAAGGAVYALGVALMGLAQSGTALAISGGVLVGLGLTGGSFTIVIAAFARLVPEDRRSWAMGLATAMGSLGQFVFAPLGQAFISAYGAATALVMIAGCVAFVPLLATALGGGDAVDDGPPGSTIGAVGEALRHPSYVLLTCGFFVCGFHIAFVTTHLPPYLTDLGMSHGVAALALGMIGLFNVLGAYMSGVLGGLYSRRLLLSGIYASRAAAFALFVVLPASPVTVLAFAALIGLLWLSTVAPTSGLIAVMFGTRHLGVLFGIVFLSHQVGAFFGVWLGGVVYDATGAYELMWWLSIALGLAAAVVHLPIQERRVLVTA